MTDSTKKFINTATNLIVNSGCSRFFINVASATMPANANIIVKGVTILGAALMGSMFGDKTYEYTVDQVKNIAENIKVELDKEESEEEK